MIIKPSIKQADPQWFRRLKETILGIIDELRQIKVKGDGITTRITRDGDGSTVHAILGGAPSIIKIAASDSSSGDKDAADVVCDGTDDQVEIQNAVNAIAENGTVFLYGGTYYLNEIENSRAIDLTKNTLKSITISGDRTNIAKLRPASFVFYAFYASDGVFNRHFPAVFGFYHLDFDSGTSTFDQPIRIDSNGAGRGVSVYIHDCRIQNSDGNGCTIRNASEVFVKNTTFSNNTGKGFAGNVVLSMISNLNSYNDNGSDGCYGPKKIYSLNDDYRNNGGFGIDGHDGYIRNASATGNGRAGINMNSGIINDSEADNNNNNGITLRQGTIYNTVANGNTEHGMYIEYGGTIYNATADNNGEDGIRIWDATIHTSRADNNGGYGIVGAVFAGNCIGTGNNLDGVNAIILTECGGTIDGYLGIHNYTTSKNIGADLDAGYNGSLYDGDGNKVADCEYGIVVTAY